MSAHTLPPRAIPERNVHSRASKTVYLSTTAGDDANDGRSAESPLASFAAAVQLVQRGEANEICLRRGQTYRVPPLRVMVAKSLRISTYGIGVRPRLMCAGGAPRFTTANDAARLSIAGVDFASSEADDPRQWPDGLCIGGGFSSVTLEDCRFQGFQVGIAVSDVSAVRLWRCIFADVWAGADLNSCADLIVEQCIFDTGSAGNEFRASASTADGLRVRHGEHAVVRDSIFHGATGVALDSDCYSTLAQQNLFISNATHAVTRGATASLTGNVFLGGNLGPDPAGVIVRSHTALLHRNVFALRRRNPGPAVRVEPIGADSVVRIREQIVRGWRGGCVDIRDGGLCAVEKCDFDTPAGAAPQIHLARPGLKFAGLQNTYRAGSHDVRLTFRCEHTSMTFDQWREHVLDLDSVIARRFTQIRVLLPQRLLANARVQSFTGWHQRLRASVLCDRIRSRL